MHIEHRLFRALLFSAFAAALLIVFSACGSDSGHDAAACGEAPAGARCSEHEYCRYDEGVCGEAEGTCSDRPEACAEVYAPVCGCDFRTYSSECDAAANGVSIVERGECRLILER